MRSVAAGGDKKVQECDATKASFTFVSLDPKNQTPNYYISFEEELFISLSITSRNYIAGRVQ